MSYFDAKEIETISKEKIGSMIRKTGKHKMDQQINENDKEPSWDGYIMLYSDEKKNKKSIICRIPIQLKGKEVKKLDNKFISFPIEICDLNNYFNDGGIIFFVVEVLAPSEEARIFYKFLLPRDIQLIKDEIKKEGQKTVNVKIDCILNEKVDFFKVCEKFKIERDHQSIAQVKNALPLEEIRPSKIEFLSVDDKFDIFNSPLYPYVRDEYNHLIPVRDVIEPTQIIIERYSDFIVKGKKYFNSYKEHRDREGERYYSFGDRIVVKGESITLEPSMGTVIERLNTIDFFVNTFSKEDLNKLEINNKKAGDILTEEKSIINRVIHVCNKYKIDLNKFYIKNLSKADYYFLEVLYDMENNAFDFTTDSNPTLVNIPIQDNVVLALKVKNDKGEKYIDYYDSNSKLILISEYEDIKLMYSRFVILNSDLLLCCNFDKDTIIKSIKSLDYNNRNNVADSYLLLALESIKAWDKIHNKEYLDLANFILEWYEDILSYEIVKINKAQIEMRLNTKLSFDTMKELYNILNSTTDESCKAAINILIGNKEGFKTCFDKFSHDEKERFSNFPIYNLYEDNVE